MIIDVALLKLAIAAEVKICLEREFAKSDKLAAGYKIKQFRSDPAGSMTKRVGSKQKGKETALQKEGTQASLHDSSIKAGIVYWGTVEVGHDFIKMMDMHVKYSINVKFLSLMYPSNDNYNILMLEIV